MFQSKMAEGGIAEKVLLREVQVIQCPLVKSDPAVTTTRLDREEAGYKSRPTASERDTVGLGTAGIFRCVLDRTDSDTIFFQ